MFSFAAVDAGKGKTNASKAIPAGLFEDPQAEWKELLVCPVEGGWKAQIERDRTLLKDGSGEGRRDLDRDPVAHQRRGGEPGENHMDLREVLRGRLPSGMPPEVEGFDGHG
jgi:hypothetical protein